ncbi:MAG: UDP-glucose/GDP-mannose dehydrogenase family protein [Candidatus Omnitrophica bacterium]|nr:UDP-glucose/GDP-mannose dehydrogenase family protein [Candidatus Omnitrophota bacterium]
MHIGVIGTGYVGLVTGACLADLGHTVLCIDNNQDKIKQLKRGVIPFYEPGLEGLVITNKNEGRLHFSANMEECVKKCEIIFICVGTPPLPSGEVDLSAIEHVCIDIAKHMKAYRLIVEKSTVPVKTGEWVEQALKKHAKRGIKYDVASNPEFLREGTAIQDAKHPDRIILGVDSDRAAMLLVKLYEPLNAPLLITDIKSAELIKHTANAFLALKVSFINAVANICERTGADVLKVAKGIGMDRRIGQDFLCPGIGYGGSCLPKDVSAYIKLCEKVGYDFKLLKEVEQINLNQRKVVISKLKKSLSRLQGKNIAVLGLSFKPDTDDMRGAPSLDIIKSLQREKAVIRAYDPVAMDNAALLVKKIKFCEDPYQALSGADAAVFVTEWRQFGHLDLPKVKKIMRCPIIIDGRNIFEPKKMAQLGFAYFGIGRTEVS